MLLLLAILLALIFLSWPWAVIVIVAAACCELALIVVGRHYARRRRADVGVEMLIGRTAQALTALDPDGQVKVNGEIWRGHAIRSVPAGTTVRIRAVRELTLEVE
jgi:membrane-bound serine protease (ClpP class)